MFHKRKSDLEEQLKKIRFELKSLVSRNAGAGDLAYTWLCASNRCSGTLTCVWLCICECLYVGYSITFKKGEDVSKSLMCISSKVIMFTMDTQLHNTAVTHEQGIE